MGFAWQVSASLFSMLSSVNMPASSWQGRSEFGLARGGTPRAGPRGKVARGVDSVLVGYRVHTALSRKGTALVFAVGRGRGPGPGASAH